MRPFDFVGATIVSEVVLLLALALLFQCVPLLKTSKSNDPYFSTHRTTVIQAALGVVALTVLSNFLSGVSLLLSNPLALYAWIYISLIVVLAFILSFYKKIGQSLSVIGFTSQSLSSVFLAGTKAAFALLLVHDLYWLLVPVSWLDGQALSHTNHDLDRYAREHGMHWTAVVAIITTFFRQGLTATIEELSYRGLLYSALRRHVSVMPALLGSSVIFMLGHDWFSPEIFMLSCLFAYLYERHHSVLPAIFVHFSWNTHLDLFSWAMSVSEISVRSWYFGSLVFSLLALGLAHYAAIQQTDKPNLLTR
ncbi:MAG: type II CAAX endopeptidase family protein [Nitrospira sp.]